jgi:large subunit ribosomal protein L24
MRIRKGDKVQVLSGKDKGKQASVVRAIPAEGKVTMQGGVIDKFMPVSVSSVAIVCNNCGPSRIGMRIDETGRKLRVCKKCGGDL